ncbi:AAA family ATPase [Dendronalium sp. ChiSLP03b]|uniref:AAA family ATPase n=1 Tax=Dendronalium sp. ChiSLP03b TaxID=3075381 RepID=UPI002AD3E7DD|nr:AAA family ATPase [Dendronalium sp. ChiSLP03b]MDZ8206171.1 AAA family ATPase [Dendronalium sp. ChiSLP03b]
MLKRIYIDNFRDLENFELNFDSINLFLGGNGSGKSTVFESLRKIQEFLTMYCDAGEVFHSSDCTRWQTSRLQRFELEISGNGGNYKYELAIEHHIQHNCHVKYERLYFNNNLLLKIDNGKCKLARDDNSYLSEFPFSSSHSAILFLLESASAKQKWFQERMERLIIVQAIPSFIENGSRKEEVQLDYKMENFVSWYRYIIHRKDKTSELNNIFKTLFNNFVDFKFEYLNEEFLILKLQFLASEDKTKIIDYRLSELSDGQKALFALYSLMYFTQSEDYTLCIDEPENFLALSEIQPWLIQLYDFCSEGKLQALLISHHPELINYLLASPIGYWFERQSNAPVRVKKISNEVAKNTGLPISELIARGWLYEPA